VTTSAAAVGPPSNEAHAIGSIIQWNFLVSFMASFSVG